MSNIKDALTRKLGPLPAWAWAAIALLGLWYYRNKMSGAASGTGTGSVAQSGPTPGTGEQVLQPGESVYDPTAGTLATAPGGAVDASGTNTAADLGNAMDNLASAIASGMPPEQVEVTLPPGSGGNRGGKGGKGHGGSHGGTSGSKKGSGHGGRHNGTSKSKGQHNSTGKTSAHKPAGAKGRPRSSATTRKNNGGRAVGAKYTPGSAHTSPGVHSGNNRPTGGVGSRARQRTRTPAVTTVVTQRRVATTPAAPANRQTGTPAPRPSAPPPRTQRAPSRPAPPPPRKRK